MPGMDMGSGGGLAPLTWATALSTWRLALSVDLVLLVAALLYVRRAHRTLPRRGERWPVSRTAAFLGALVVLAVTLQSSIDVYGHELFWMHMIEHLVLIMVVPVLLVLGQPIKLACAGTDGPAIRTTAALRSRTVSVFTFPAVGLAAYGAVLVGTHLSGFIRLMTTHMWLHDVEIGLYLASGYLFFLPLLAHEPIERELSYPLRVFMTFVGMTADTVVGVMLMMGTQPELGTARGWGPAPLDDLHLGGGIMWVVGDGLMFLVTLLTVAQWMRDTDGQNDTGKWLSSARRSALHMDPDADPDVDIDNDDGALAAYNRMLAGLNRSGDASGTT
jgi:putative copper resistance protein D